MNACQPVSAILLSTSMVRHAWPEVDAQLDLWRSRLPSFGDGRLRDQAGASLDTKAFHCQGGSVFALMQPPRSRAIIAPVVALQTISDYLDNLCDRAGVHDVAAFDRLHDAMRDAVDPGRVPGGSYYDRYPAGDDGGYLEELVGACRRGTAALPSYGVVRDHVVSLTDSYIRLQVLKHGPEGERARELEAWIRPRLEGGENLKWWEYAAACGSTLGIFALMAAASSRRLGPGPAAAIAGAYFPWIGALHILLDYLIDQAEDERGGDLNFVALYDSAGDARLGLRRLLDRSLEEAARLDGPRFHTAVVQGLLALYLTDPKARSLELRAAAADLLGRGRCRLLAGMCRALRRLGRVGSGPSAAQVPGQPGEDPV